MRIAVNKLKTEKQEKIHGTLRMAPAMAEGVSKNLWTIRNLIEMTNG